MNITISNKTTELKSQAARSLKCSSPLLHKWLLNCSCNAQNERTSSSFSLLWINLSHFHPKTMKLVELQAAAAALRTENINFRTCSIHGSAYLRRCWSSGLLWSGAALWVELVEGEARCTVVVWAVYTFYLSAPLFGRNRQGDIFKEPTWSLKTKKHVTRLQCAGGCSRIGFCTAIHPTNGDPVINRGEQHDDTLTRCHLTLSFFPHRFGIWGQHARWHCICH